MRADTTRFLFVFLVPIMHRFWKYTTGAPMWFGRPAGQSKGEGRMVMHVCPPLCVMYVLFIVLHLLQSSASNPTAQQEEDLPRLKRIIVNSNKDYFRGVSSKMSIV